MIDDTVLAGRLPRLGSITTGYGVEATSRAGNPYARPVGADTLVLHTNDEEVAAAVLERFGGDLRDDSPNWRHDVVTATRDLDLLILPAGLRQAMEHWRAAECTRRCDGVRMVLLAGKPCDRPCLCAEEMATGAERACAPHTILPAMLDLPVERWGVWEIRSTGYGSAQNLKGTVRALAMIGVTAGSVPARLSMVDRTTRDQEGRVREITDLSLTIARSLQSLTELASQTTSALPATTVASLPSGDAEQKLAALQRWTDVQGRGFRLGLRDAMIDLWRSLYGARDLEDLTADELDGWVDAAADLLADAEKQIRADAT